MCFVELTGTVENGVEKGEMELEEYGGIFCNNSATRW